MKTKFKEIKCEIPFDIFPYKLTVIVSNDILKSRSKYDTILGRKYSNEFAGAIHDTNHDGNSYVFLKSDATPGTIAHESFHVIWELLDFIGANDNNELIAYLMTYIVNNIHVFIKKHWKK